MSEPTDFDVDVLRAMNGEDVPGMAWGAAMSVAIEYLYGAGYASRNLKNGVLAYVPSEKGLALLAERSPSHG